MCQWYADISSLPNGTSGERHSWTCAARGVAFVNEFKYWRAKFKATGSCISIITASSSLSILAVCESFTFPGGATKLKM